MEATLSASVNMSLIFDTCYFQRLELLVQRVLLWAIGRKVYQPCRLKPFCLNKGRAILEKMIVTS